MSTITVWHIPACPFCQRLEVLLERKGMRGVVRFEAIDVTKPRPDWLLAKTGGSTSLPILEDEYGRVLKESLVLLRYLDARFGERVARADPYEAAVEDMLIAKEGPFVVAGYQFVRNLDPNARPALERAMLDRYAELGAFLTTHGSTTSPFLFDTFGLAEVVFTPMFQRFWFLEYYEGFDLPSEPRFERVRAWRDACVAHPAARQTSKEEVVKLYYDYAKGVGNGGLLAGRARSSFALEPHWRARPWPPADKYAVSATDAELGLV
jgi:glutathione S-transferase